MVTKCKPTRTQAYKVMYVYLEYNGEQNLQVLWPLCVSSTDRIKAIYYCDQTFEQISACGWMCVHNINVHV